MSQEEIMNALDDVLRFGGGEVHKLFLHILTQTGLFTPNADTSGNDTADTSNDTVDTSNDVVVSNRRKSN